MKIAMSRVVRVAIDVAEAWSVRLKSEGNGEAESHILQAPTLEMLIAIKVY
jgi:hypothetical protein